MCTCVWRKLSAGQEAFSPRMWQRCLACTSRYGWCCAEQHSRRLCLLEGPSVTLGMMPTPHLTCFSHKQTCQLWVIQKCHIFMIHIKDVCSSSLEGCVVVPSTFVLFHVSTGLSTTKLLECCNGSHWAISFPASSFSSPCQHEYLAWNTELTHDNVFVDFLVCFECGF